MFFCICLWVLTIKWLISDSFTVCCCLNTCRSYFCVKVNFQIFCTDHTKNVSQICPRINVFPVNRWNSEYLRLIWSIFESFLVMKTQTELHSSKINLWVLSAGQTMEWWHCFYEVKPSLSFLCFTFLLLTYTADIYTDTNTSVISSYLQIYQQNVIVHTVNVTISVMWSDQTNNTQYEQTTLQQVSI